MESTSRRLFALAAEAVGLPSSELEDVSFPGDGELPSAFAITDFAAATVATAAAGVRALRRLATGDAPALTVDRRLSALWFKQSIAPVGWTLPDAWDAVAGDYAARDGWIRLHTNAPHHRAAALRVLGCPNEREAVAAAVRGWDADALESAVVEAGGCAARMRDTAAWRAHPQGAAVAAEPLVAWTTRPAPSLSAWRPDASRPLAGIRVLDLTRILAGPVATRFLAGHGADVLRLDPVDWDEPSLAPDVTLGKRCARVDLRDPAGRVTFETLLAQADVLVHGYRNGALDALGYGDAARAALNPRLVDVSLDAYGWTGPWAGRRGFDSLVQMSCGIAARGQAWKAAGQPVPLPMQALDHGTGYLIAAAAVRGLARRVEDGVASRARLSLARTGWLVMDEAADPAPADAPAIAPQADDWQAALEHTTWGGAKRLKPPATIAGVDMAWPKPAGPLGADAARWSDG